MRCLFLGVLFLATLHLVGQNNEWNWGVMVLPEYSAKTISKSNTIDGDRRFGLSIQPTISAQLTGSIEIISGVIYDYSHLSYRDYSVIRPCDWNGFGYYDRTSYMVYGVQAHSLGLPIHAKWDFFAQESSAFLKFGFNQLFTIASEENQELIECGLDRPAPPENVRQVNDIRSEIELGLGLEVAHQKQYKLILELVSGLTLNGMFECHKSFDTVRFLDLGVRMGIVFY